MSSLSNPPYPPGYTFHDQDTVDSLIKPVHSFQSSLSQYSNKKIILLTSNVIKDNMIFANGLYQNILNFYNMFESMGHIPLILFDEKPEPEDIKDFLKNYRYVLPETVIKSEIPIYCLIEIGMTIQPEFRQFLKDFGTKIMKIFLGNILNIDVEISTRMPEVNFPHHFGGHYNLLLSSPHYNQNKQYAAAIHNTSYEMSKVAPYVWSDEILKKSLGQSQKPKTWDATKNWRKRNIIIMEPNLGFQKCFYVPLLIAAAFARKNSEWEGNIKIYNFQNVLRNKNFEANIYPLLGLNKERIELLSRFPINEIMESNRDAVFIHHQVNNEFNYMFFELMSQGFPVIHNVDSWKNYAYYYSTFHSGSQEVTKLLYKVFSEHSQNISVYKCHYECLAWSHSIYNPSNQKIWNELLFNPLLENVLS